MQIEAVQNFEKNRSKYKDFREALSDSHLDEDEQKELTRRYYNECEAVHEESHNSCDELKQEMVLYEEMTEMSRTEIKVLQTILGFSGDQRDGLRGPNTFAGYMELAGKYDIFTGMSPKQVIETFIGNIRDLFEGLPESKRKEVQGEVGTYQDGIYGPNTQSKILENFEEVRGEFLKKTTNHEVVGSTSLLPAQKFPKTQAEIEETVTPEATVVEQVTGIEQEKLPIETKVVTQVQEAEISISTTQGGHHSKAVVVNERVELLTDQEKIEKFKSEAKLIHPVLIEFLQAGVSTGVDGNFGGDSAKAVITKYPDAQSLEDVMQIEGIPMQSDSLLPGGGGVESRDIFRQRYGNYIALLEGNLRIPTGLVEAISRQESKYGAIDVEGKHGAENLISHSGCKGIMQLSSVSMEDMKMAHRGGTIYRKLFQSLDIDTLLSTEIADGKTAQETIPSSIVKNLRQLHNPNTSDKDYDDAIELIRIMLKEDNTYFNHATNIIMGSIYLSGAYNDPSRGNGSSRKAAYHYNGDTALVGDRVYKGYYNNKGKRPQHREHYAMLVDGYHAEIQGEEPSLKLSIKEDEIPMEKTSEEVSRYPKERVQEAISWIKEEISEYNMKRLMLYFEVQTGDINGLAVATMDFQLEKKLIPVDGKPGKNTLSKIDFTQVDIELSPKSNTEFINTFVPDRWKESFTKFVDALKPNEILSPQDPITVCNSNTNTALFLVNGEYKEMKVGFGLNGFSDGYVSTNDKKTPKNVVTRFSSVNIPKDPYGDASNTGSSTVKGAALLGNDTITTKKVRLEDGRFDYKQTGKWHHGVIDRRVGKNDSNGCVTYSVSDIREIAQAIRKNNGKGYGYVA